MKLKCLLKVLMMRCFNYINKCSNDKTSQKKKKTKQKKPEQTTPPIGSFALTTTLNLLKLCLRAPAGRTFGLRL